MRGLGLPTREPIRETCARITCPTLVIHGDLDLIRPHAQGQALARGDAWRVGHARGRRAPADRARSGQGEPAAARLPLPAGPAAPLAAAAPREPSGRSTSPRRSASAMRGATSRSPTSCAGCTPTCRSTGSPRTRSPRCWRRDGERIHPASAQLAGESAHIAVRGQRARAARASRRSGGWTRSCSRTSWSSTTSCASSPTTCGSATRRGSSTTSCTRTRSCKTAAYAWLTDFVGWLPMPDGGAREAALTADYNAEMIEQIARYPRVRDRSIFVGDPDDIVPGTFGPRLPLDPRLDRAPLQLLPATSPASTRRRLRDRDATARRARLRRRRAGVHRHRRRLGRRRGAAAARDRELPGGQAARPASCG